MKLVLKRYSENEESTLGLIFVDGVFSVYSLEDEGRDKKVMHETRIPAGTYKIVLATWGGHHERYSKMFPEIHKGMLLLQNVPGFTGILIHIGNTDDDTSGCLLVGNTVNNNKIASGYLGDSKEAYKRFYFPIAKAISDGEEVTITVEDICGSK